MPGWPLRFTAKIFVAWVIAKARTCLMSLFTARRYRAIFTNSPFTAPQAEEHHPRSRSRRAGLRDWTVGPLSHLPSSSFPPRPPGWRSPRSAATYCAPAAWELRQGEKNFRLSAGGARATELGETALGAGHVFLVRLDRDPAATQLLSYRSGAVAPPERVQH